ncbi:hypothetical protein KI387_026728, partial [Taxus chinensis]
MEPSLPRTFEKGEPSKDPSRMSFRDAIQGPRDNFLSSNPAVRRLVRLVKEDPRKTPTGCMQAIDGTPVIKIATSYVEANIQELENHALIIHFPGFKPSLPTFKEWARKTWNIPDTRTNMKEQETQVLETQDVIPPKKGLENPLPQLVSNALVVHSEHLGELKSYQRKHKVSEEHRKKEMGNGQNHGVPLLPSSVEIPPYAEPFSERDPIGFQQEKHKKVKTKSCTRLPVPFVKRKWQSPLFDFVKLNTDGAARGNPGPTSIGGIAHDSLGTLLFFFGSSIGALTNNVAEILAIQKTLLEATKLGCLRIIVESDSK